MDSLPAPDGAAGRVAQLEVPDAFVGAELRRLAADYPAFRFRSQRGWDRARLRWVAERMDGMNEGLHTVITADLGELRAALDLGAASRSVIRCLP